MAQHGVQYGIKLHRKENGLAIFSQMLADGQTRATIAAEFEVSEWTVSEWRKRPEVQQMVAKIIRERANRILSQTDSRIEKKLQEKGDKMSIDQLLKVRTAFAIDGEAGGGEGEAGGALAELMAAAHRDPELAAALRRALPVGEAPREGSNDDEIETEVIEDDD